MPVRSRSYNVRSKEMRNVPWFWWMICGERGLFTKGQRERALSKVGQVSGALSPLSRSYWNIPERATPGFRASFHSTARLHSLGRQNSKRALYSTGILVRVCVSWLVDC